MKLLASLVCALLLMAQTPETQPLIIVVRDAQGSPLEGVSLTLLVTGPPDEPFTTCATGADGECRLLVPPGAYIVRFEGGWQGQSFVPADQQNGGALGDGGTSGGGFGIYLEPGREEQIIAFVVGRKAGQLVPIWDMSRSPFAPPQPYAPSTNPFDASSDGLAGIDLAPLVSDEATPEGTMQIVESTVDIGAVATSTPGPTPTASTDGGWIPSASFWLAVICLILALAIAVIFFIYMRVPPKERR